MAFALTDVKVTFSRLRAADKYHPVVGRLPSPPRGSDNSSTSSNSRQTVPPQWAYSLTGSKLVNSEAPYDDRDYSPFDHDFNLILVFYLARRSAYRGK
jgi:hypothetical protein